MDMAAGKEIIIENAHLEQIAALNSSIIIESESTQTIFIRNCCFVSLSAENEARSGAVFILNNTAEIKDSTFESCLCKNQREDGASNAVYTLEGSTKFLMSTVLRCSESVSLADSSVYFYGPGEIVVKENNFSRNNGATSHSGASSVETLRTNSVAVDYVTDYSGVARRSMYLTGGTLKASNIIGFKGEFLLGNVALAESCCFFRNDLWQFVSFPVKNCLSDDARINSTKIVETKILHEFGEGCIYESCNVVISKYRSLIIVYFCKLFVIP